MPKGNYIQSTSKSRAKKVTRTPSSTKTKKFKVKGKRGK